mgnify:CR=1 FL=1
MEQATKAQRIVAHFDQSGSSAGYIAVLLAQGERGLGHYQQALQWSEHAEAILAERIALRCFTVDPSIGSSLKFLRKTPWAREKVESLYLYVQRKQAKSKE